MTDRPEPPIPTTGLPPTWTKEQWRVYGWEYFAKHPERHPSWVKQVEAEEQSNSASEPELPQNPPRPPGLPPLSESASKAPESSEPKELGKPPRPPGLLPLSESNSRAYESSKPVEPRKPPRPPGLPPISTSDSTSSAERLLSQRINDGMKSANEIISREAFFNVINGAKQRFPQSEIESSGVLDGEEESVTFLSLLGSMIVTALVALFTFFSPIIFVGLAELIGLGCIFVGISILLDKRQGILMKLMALIAIILGIICFVIGVYFIWIQDPPWS